MVASQLTFAVFSRIRSMDLTAAVNGYECALVAAAGTKARAEGFGTWEKRRRDEAVSELLSMRPNKQNSDTFTATGLLAATSITEVACLARPLRRLDRAAQEPLRVVNVPNHLMQELWDECGHQDLVEIAELT